jgi:hypothetical protein
VLNCELTGDEIDSGFKIRYMDIVSLYQYVMSAGVLYPAGDMRIISGDRAKYRPNETLDLDR